MKTIDVQSMVDLLNVDHTTLDAGDRIRTMSYHPPTFPSTHFYGGRSYIWTPTRPKNDHDGGTYISLTCPWDGTQAGLEDFLNGVGDLDPCSNGCLVLEKAEEVWVEDYGAVGGWTSMTGAINDWPSFNAAVNRALHEPDGDLHRAGIVRARDTIYFLTQTLELTQPVEFRGMYSQLAGDKPCELLFDTDLTGLYVDPLATNVLISGLTVTCWSGTDTTKHGLWMRFRTHVEYCRFRQFGGNGVNIVGSANDPDPLRDNNVNGWSLFCVKCDDNGGDGVYVDGADSNAGVGYKVDCVANTGWGINDSSFLGNTWIACHTAFNDGGAYQSDGDNAQSLFLGCYSEQGQPESQFAQRSLFLSGLHGAGVSDASKGGGGEDMKLGGLTVTSQSQVVKGSSNQTGYFVATNTNGSGPNSAFETGFMGNSSVKADGITPRPSGGMYTAPFQTNRDNASQVGFYVYTGETVDTLVKVARFVGTTDFSPLTDNLTDLGWSGGQWKDLYLANSPTVSSDAKLKQDVAELSDAEQAVAVRLKGLVRTYRMKAAVAKKGNKARTHVGIIAQDVVSAFAAEGLDAWDYGIVCRGPGPKNVGERFSVRYEELLAFMIAAL